MVARMQGLVVVCCSSDSGAAEPFEERDEVQGDKRAVVLRW